MVVVLRKHSSSSMHLVNNLMDNTRMSWKLSSESDLLDKLGLVEELQKLALVQLEHPCMNRSFVS